MMKTALVALVSLGLAPAAVAAEQAPAQERPPLPAEGEATLADCQVWIDTLGELIEEADPPVSEEVLAEAEAMRERAAQACETGDYHEGITLAADAIEMIESEADVDAPDTGEDAGEDAEPGESAPEEADEEDTPDGQG